MAADPIQRGDTGIDSAWYEEVEAWHRDRIEQLKADRGWLRLNGLYWLKEGEQSFGSGSNAQIRFPAKSWPPLAGIYKVRNDSVSIKIITHLDIRDERGNLIRDGLIYTPDSQRILTYRGLTWFVIRRGDKLGIRLYDENSPHLQHFEGIDRYDVDPKWRIKAEFTPESDGRAVIIENILGDTMEWEVGGKLHFDFDGKTVSLITFERGDRLFIPFADATSGNETYSGGRFLMIGRPLNGKPAILDFNQSYNPPCALNPYTTCPIPPQENRKDFPIRAGEKKYQKISGD